MSAFAINRTPLMTTFLIRELKAFRNDPIVILDIGARGGIDPEWRVFGDQLRVYCFEPDAVECQRLAAGASPQLTYIPRALSRTLGTATLYQTGLAASTSLYQTRMDYFGRLLNRDNGVTVGQRTVEVSSLDDALAEYSVKSVDFIKLDTEGAELDILRGGRACLTEAVPLGVLSEVRFHEEINGSPPFASLDSFLRKAGFRLYDLQFAYQSRNALPYPGLADYRKPSGERFFAYTTRGQMQDGDALYFRDLLLQDNRGIAQTVSAAKILKLCSLLEVYSFNDCAAELIQSCRARIDSIVESSRLLDLLASGIAGCMISYEDYMRSYFNNPVGVELNEPTTNRHKVSGPRIAG